MHAQVTELSLSDKETPKLTVKIATELLGEVVQSSMSLELRRDGDSARLEKQNIKGFEFTHAVSVPLLEHLRDAMVSHDDRRKSELKLYLTAAAKPLGVIRVDLATLLSSREQQLGLRVMDEKEGLRAVQVGRAAISVRVPDAALKISLQMHTAARMQAVAALCARAGQPKEAKALLELAHKRRQLDPPAVGLWRSAQKSHAPVAAKAADASWQLPAAEMLLQSGDTAWPSTLVAAVAAKAADASWQLPAAEMLLRSGDTAWPPTLVALADSVEHDFVKRALEMRQASEANPFRQGAVVLYQLDYGGFSYGKIVQAAQLIDGRGWYEFADQYGDKQRVPSYSVFAVSSSGVGAVLREAAAAGKVDLVNELLLRGVSPFESDAQATTALHRAASGGSEQSEEVCRRLCAAGAVGSAQNMQNLTPLDLAVRSKNVRCRRVFEPSASDKDVQEYMEATGVQTSMSEGYLPEATMDAHSPVRKQSGSPVRVTPGSRRGYVHEAGAVATMGITPLMLAARAASWTK